MTTTSMILAKYGEPGVIYQSKFCEVWKIADDFSWFPASKIFINSDFKKKLFSAFFNLEKTGCSKEIKTFDGCYNDRTVRGRNSTSLHAWAMAIDLNASLEKLGQVNTGWSGQFVAIMKAAGIYWGGDWISRKDPMHFALFNG